MKKLLPLTVLALVFSACNTPTTPQPTPEAVTTLSGHVAQGSGTGTVKLTTQAGVTLAQANVSDSGNFTLDLPASDKLTSELVTASEALTKVGCEGTLTSSVPSALGYGVVSLNLSRGSLSDIIMPIDISVSRFLGVPTGGSADGRVWLYTDQPTTLTGNVNCTKVVNSSVPINIAVNVTTVKGWNRLRLSGSLSLTSMAVNGKLENTSVAWTEWKTLTELKSTLTF